MADPIPDPRMDPINDSSDSSVEEVDEIFKKINKEDDHKDIGKTGDTKSKPPSRRGSKKSRKRPPKKDLVCDECRPKRLFKTQKILDLHKQYLHKEVNYVICMWCAKQFLTQNQLLVHQTLYSHDKPLE